MSRAKAAIAFYTGYLPRHQESDVLAGERGFRRGWHREAAAAQLEIIEDGIIAECQAAAKKYDSLYQLEIGPLQQDIESGRKRLVDGLRRHERNLIDRHADQLAKLGLEWGVQSPRQTSQRERIDELERREAYVLAEVDGRPPRYGSLVFYILFMFALTIAEVPVNRSAFELFFRETPLLATMVALLCGGMLVFLAHAAGEVLRQFGYNANKHSLWAPLSSLLLIFVVAAVLVAGLALLRQGFVDFILNRAANPGVAEMLEQGQYRAAIFQVAANGLRADGYIFLSINVAMLAVGVIASYFKHDSQPDYEKVDRGLKAARARLTAVQASHARKEARLTGRHQDAMRGLLRNIQDSEARLNRLEADLHAKEKERRADFEAVHMVTRRRVLAYRQGFCGKAAENGVSEIPTRPLPGLVLPPPPGEGPEGDDAP